LFCIVDELLIEEGEVDDEEVDDGELLVEDGAVEDEEVDDGAVLDGYCELLCVAEDDEDDGLDDVLWSDEDVCANAPQHMPAAQRSVMILVP